MYFILFLIPGIRYMPGDCNFYIQCVNVKHRKKSEISSSIPEILSKHNGY